MQTHLLQQEQEEEEPDRFNNDIDHIFTLNQRSQEVYRLAKLTVPISAGYLLQTSIGLASIFSLGHVGTKELAASALATMFANVTGFSLGHGMSSALDTLCSQAHTGSTDKHILGKHLQRGFVVMALLCIPVILIWLYTKELLLLAGQSSELSELSATFTFYLIPGLFPYFVSECIKKYLQAQNIMNAPLQILLFLSPINMLLQYLLVWDPTFTLGFKGAAIASSITYSLNAIFMILYVRFYNGGDAWGGLDLREAFDYKQLWAFLRLGIPGILMICSEWWAFEVIALAAGILGDDMLAAQTVVLNTCGLTYMIPLGVSIACTTKIGNSLGALQPNRAKLSAECAILLGFSLAFFNGLFLFSVRNTWGYLWNSDHHLNSIIASILPLASLFQLSDAVGVVGSGVLRGIGAQKFGAIINIMSYYVLGLPFGLWLTFGTLKMNLLGLWIGITVALCTVGVVQVAWIMRIDWEEKALEARRRIALDCLNDECIDETDEMVF